MTSRSNHRSTFSILLLTDFLVRNPRRPRHSNDGKTSEMPAIASRSRSPRHRTVIGRRLRERERGEQRPATMAPNDLTVTNASPSNSDCEDLVSRVFLIRHGDRFDYANDHWVPAAKKFGALTTDPPLSALGHRQAQETASHLLKTIGKDDNNGTGSSSSKIAKILVSPYLRVIQTACPTSDVFGIQLSIEHGLSEAHATPGSVLPSAEERFAYFPHVDPTYQSLQQVEPSTGFICPKTGHPCEAFAGHYTKRMGEFAEKIEEHYRGETIVCFSHAASVALIAALLKCSMRELKFAACGVYELERVNDGPWRMVNNGDSNPHVSETSSTTYPWGFSEKHFREVDGGRYYGESEGIDLDYFVPSS